MEYGVRSTEYGARNTEYGTKIILSDLHLGAGYFNGANPLEDFRHDDRFYEFMQDLRAESDATGRPMELIINGDMIEFLQVPAVPVSEYDPRARYPEEAYRSTTEADSVLRTDLVIAGHRPVFEGLGAFLSENPRRTVTIIKGNHDVLLHWPGVQERIRQAVGATGPRASLLTFAARSICRDGIYVEHGNQYRDPLNRLDNFENPVDPRHPDRLQTPIGSRFVIEFYNHIEYERWWIDAIKPIPALIAYGMVLDPKFALKALGVLMTALPGMVFRPFAAEGGNASPLGEVREESLEEAVRRYESDPAYRRAFNAALQEYLWTLGPGVPRTAWGRAAMLETGRRISRSFSDGLVEEAQRIVHQQGVSLVVFGHTHEARMDILDGGVYVNTGTWTWWRDFSQADLEMWRRLLADPGAFMTPHYLTYVRVEHDPDGRPQATLHDLSGALALPKARLFRRKWWQFWRWVRRT